MLDGIVAVAGEERNAFARFSIHVHLRYFFLLWYCVSKVGHLLTAQDFFIVLRRII